MKIPGIGFSRPSANSSNTRAVWIALKITPLVLPNDEFFPLHAQEGHAMAQELFGHVLRLAGNLQGNPRAYFKYAIRDVEKREPAFRPWP